MEELIQESSRLAAADDWGPIALTVNEELAGHFPETPKVQARLGDCYLEAGRLDEAYECFEKAKEVGLPQPSSKIVEAKLADIDERRRAARESDFGRALREATELRDAAHLDRARVWFRRAYELASLAKERVATLTALASMQRAEQRFDAALRVIERAVSLDPSRQTNKASYTVLIAVLTDLGRAAPACSEADRLLEVHPTDPYVLNAAGRAYQLGYRKTGYDSYARRARTCFSRARAAPALEPVRGR